MAKVYVVLERRTGNDKEGRALEQKISVDKVFLDEVKAVDYVMKIYFPKPKLSEILFSGKPVEIDYANFNKENPSTWPAFCSVTYEICETNLE